MTDVKVIIVNYNAGRFLLECVERVLASGSSLCVVVADNASSDGSAKALAERFRNDERLQVHVNRENLGFARAVNRVARDASEKYLLILNPDCMVGPETIARLVEALEADSGAAAAGPWVTNEGGGMQQGTWRRFPDPWRSLLTFTGLARLAGDSEAMAGVNVTREHVPDGPVRVDAVSGACLMLRREMAESVGFYDEGYAMHCEDLDLMYRLSTLGHHSVLVPAATAVHRGGVSTASRPWWVHRQKHAGMHRYFRKFQADHYGWPFRWLVYLGIWVHYLLTLPMILFRRITRAA